MKLRSGGWSIALGTKSRAGPPHRRRRHDLSLEKEEGRPRCPAASRHALNTSTAVKLIYGHEASDKIRGCPYIAYSPNGTPLSCRRAMHGTNAATGKPVATAKGFAPAADGPRAKPSPAPPAVLIPCSEAAIAMTCKK